MHCGAILGAGPTDTGCTASNVCGALVAAHAIRAGRQALAANRVQLQTIVDEMAPGLTERRGIGVVTAAQAIVSFSHPGRCRSDAAFAALSGTSPLPAAAARRFGIGSTAAATEP
jgi:transposase